MKICVTDGCLVRGRPVQPGAELDLAANDALDLLACGKAVALDSPEAVRAANAAQTAAMLRALRGPQRW
jgi:hypothetical protein